VEGGRRHSRLRRGRGRRSRVVRTSRRHREDLFQSGYDFLHHPPDAKKEDNAGTRSRVWAHKTAHAAGKCPLIIYLHGNNGEGYLKQNDPPLFGPGVGSNGSLHAGKLLAPEIAAGKVVPLVVACLTVFKNGNKMWTPAQFDLSTFVQEVKDLLAGLPDDAQVEIDLDCVAVTGHSGAGGNPGNSLNRVAEQKGRFTVDGNSHELTLFGVMDTRTDEVFGNVIRKGLSKNVDVYAVHRLHGGWRGEDQSHENFCKGLLGKTRADFAPAKELEQEHDLVTTEKPCCDSASTPLRISIAVVQDDKRWAPHLAQWVAIADAYKDYGGRWTHHFDTVPLWTLWAARRYFSPGACKAKATRPKGSGCDDCDALQAMIDAGDVADRLRFGSKDSEAIEHLQYHLVELGYPLPKSNAHPDGIDGDFGNGTVKALAAFLNEIGMPGDGKSVTPEIAKAVVEKHKQGFKSTATPKK
jgi:hypothetical protein